MSSEHSQSPLHWVRVGGLTLTENRVVVSADDEALLLIGGSKNSKERVVGQALEVCLQPLNNEGVSALIAWPPASYVGVAAATSVQCLVKISCLPGQSSGPLLATVIAVNEYLAKSQALANVQLRSTVQSIIGGFAHEVRNPLAAILSLTEAALDENPSPDTTLVRIPSLVARIESLIRQSLAYSRPKHPSRALHQASFVLEHAVALLRPRQRTVKLELSEAEHMHPVMVDLPQGEQILVNLLENALDAARSKVQVRISAGNTPVPSVCIEVSDDGPGVADDIAARIFEPFFTTKAEGTGLGLAIARDLTRLNGGDLRLVRTARAGATFRMFLPSTENHVLGTASL